MLEVSIDLGGVLDSLSLRITRWVVGLLTLSVLLWWGTQAL